MIKLSKTFTFRILSILLFIVLFVSCTTIKASANDIKKGNEKIEDISKDNEKALNNDVSNRENAEKKDVDITEQRMTKNGDVFYRVLGINYYSSNPYAEGIYIARSLQDAIAISEGNEKYNTLFEKVDFKKEVLVFIFAGRRNTGGYSIEVDSIKRDGKGKILAEFSIISPSMGDVVTQAITSPSMIIAIEAKKGEIIKTNIK